MQKGERAHVTARGLTLDGEATAELDGREVLCPGVFPGEQAEVRIAAVSRHHARAYAELLRLTTPHPQRRPAPCPNHVARSGACHGCALMELDEAAQRELKRNMLRERFGLAVERIETDHAVLGYRWSAKRVALGRKGALRLGSYARYSHAPASMTGCLVDHPMLRAAFDALERRADTLAIEPFDEVLQAGDLRYVWGKTNGSAVVLTLVTANRESRARALLGTPLEGVAGMSWSVQGARSNALRGSAAEALWGLAELPTELLGQRVELGALGFLQPNPRVAELAYEALTSQAEGNSPARLAFDLYAGAGLTTGKLRERFAEVRPCEAYPESAAALGVPAQSVEQFLADRLADAAAERPDLVVANPPRKGMGRAVCAALVELGSPELRVMSCGPEGLARDLAQLSAGYELVSLRAFDTLPQTPHVELVARLRRRGTND